MDSNSHLEFFYGSLYTSIDAQGPLGWFHRLTHKQLESGLDEYFGESILEIGVNRGEHLTFVKHPFDLYVATDYRVTDLDLGAKDSKVSQAACSAELLPFLSASFDRVVLTCVLHHLRDPLMSLSEIRRVTKPNGIISILLPCDPGLAYRISWAMTSGRRLRRLGVVNPQLFHSLEHHSHFAALRTYIAETFKNDKINTRWWPWRSPSWNLNLFTVISVQVRKSQP